MAEIIISSYFEENNAPVTGLSPTLRIWEISISGDDLIVGAPCGSGQNTDGAMVEAEDCGSPAETDGFYRFTFTDTIGYDATKTYVVRVDGGASLTTCRYQTEKITPADAVSVQNVVDGVLDEPRLSHNIAGTVGEAINLDRADITAIRTTDLPAILSLLDLVRKYETNRTEVDPATNSLIVYDDDCTTVLRVFSLFDSTGTGSVTDVCERVPKASVGGVGSTTDGQPVCP